MNRSISEIVEELYKHPDVIWVNWMTKQDVVDHYNAETDDAHEFEIEDFNDEYDDIAGHIEDWYDNMWYNNDLPFRPITELSDEFVKKMKRDENIDRHLGE